MFSLRLLLYNHSVSERHVAAEARVADDLVSISLSIQNIFNRNDRQTMWQSLRRTSSQFFRNVRDMRRRFVTNVRNYSFFPSRFLNSNGHQQHQHQQSAASVSPNLSSFASGASRGDEERRRRRQFAHGRRPSPAGHHK